MQFSTALFTVVGLLAAGSTACTPAHFRCNGAVLQTCNTSGHWVKSADCSSPATCSIQQNGLSGFCK